MSNELKIGDETLDRLMTEHSNAVFACGEWTNDSDESYDALTIKAGNAYEALVVAIRKHRVSNVPEIPPPRQVCVPVDIAIAVRAAFLPKNPNKMRGADPEIVAAAKAFIAAVDAASTGR